MRRLLCVILSVILLTGFVSCGDSQNNTPPYTEGLQYQSNYDGTCNLVGIGSYTGTEIRVPDKSPEGDRVVRVAPNAFENNTTLTDITFSPYVTEIGAYAFSGCTALETITLPDNLVTLGIYAYKGCTSADKMYIGPRVKTIGDGAFFACHAVDRVFYEGTKQDWNRVSFGVNNSSITAGVIWFYYSPTRPTESGYFWYYRNGAIAIWQ